MALADQAGAGAFWWTSCTSQQGQLLPFESSHAACTSLPQQPACHGLLVVPGEARLTLSVEETTPHRD